MNYVLMKIIKYYVWTKIGSLLLTDILIGVKSIVGMMPSCPTIDNLEHVVRKIYDE
jgi:hypothetical protein